MKAALDWLANEPLGRIVWLIIAIALISLTARMVRVVVFRQVQDTSLHYRARKLINGLAYAIFVVTFVSIFGIKFGDFAVMTGVAGAGIAFALQEVIASIAGYAANSFGGFFRLGDRVQLGGIRGDVIDITVLRTTLLEVGDWVQGDLYNGRIVRVANSFVFKEPVFNYSADFPFVWDEIRVSVKYDSDFRHAKKLFEAVAQEKTGEFVERAQMDWENVQRKYRVERASLTPMVSLVASESWIEFTIRYIVPFDKRRLTKDALFEAVLDAVDGSEGRVEFGSKTIDILGMAKPKEI